MLRVNLLGPASFSVEQSLVKPELGSAGRLLACYLFEFMGRAHRRERLADLFWGELQPEKARIALNTAIWRIRKMLDFGLKGGSRSLLTVGSDVLLEPAQFIKVDTHVLDTACRGATTRPQSKQLTETDEHELAAAIESYHGPFLDGDDDDWVLQERERLHSLFVRSTLELMRAAARRKEYECALAFGRRVLATDPWRENIQQNVMLLLVVNGQRAGAIRNYERLRTLLQSDSGIDPMPDTKRLHQEISTGEIFSNVDSHVLRQFGEP